MDTIESTLKPIKKYLISFQHQPENDWFVLDIGLPNTWVYDENENIGCEKIEEYEIGKIIRISPKKKTVIIDDLIKYVETIILINEKIAEKEQEFKDKMKEMKDVLESEVKKFYRELDELKENSFKKIDPPKSRKRKPKTTTPKTESVEQSNDELVDEKN